MIDSWHMQLERYHHPGFFINLMDIVESIKVNAWWIGLMLAIIGLVS